MLTLLLAAAATAPDDADQRLAAMAALYEEVCLKAFPDDAAVATLMEQRGAQAMSPDVVRVTMGSDPARGWVLPEDKGTVWLELPPFHACSVRWNAPRIGDLSPYRAVADHYEVTRKGFGPIRPMEAQQGAIHIHATGDRRVLSDQSIETLFAIDQQISDPKRRAAGETGFSLRFVHQYAPPAPPRAN